MPDVLITVQNKIATLTNTPVIVCGNSDYKITFTFDSEFSAYTAKTLRVVFRDKGRLKHYDILFRGNEVDLPPVYCVDQIAVGVCAGDVISTTMVVIPCQYGDVSEHADPPPDIYEQLLEYLAEIQGGGAGVVTGAAAFDVAATGTVSTVTETPPTVHITCDPGYYFDSPVTCTLGGNQRQKSNSVPAIGVIAHFFGYCDPIFISPLPEGVLCTVGNDTVPANRTLTYGGIAWYWSTVNNGVGGSYDDSEGNMLTYPGSINSDGYSASGGISPTYIKQILEYVHASAWEEF